jgi:predicted MFS family arabinose efflux permease
MSTVDKKSSWFALVTGHMAGMIDLAALPVWVGTLIAGYSFLPAQAGGLATLFLFGVVLCNLVVSPRFHKLNGRWLAPFGFWVAAISFAAMTRLTDFVPMAALHFVAGVGTGIGISLTHGTMGLSANPHRVFAIASFGLGVLAVVYLGITPNLIAESGPSMLFWVFAAVMGVAAVLHTLFFPSVVPSAATQSEMVKTKTSPKVWFLVFGIAFMALNNAMALSFAGRAGVDFGFEPQQVQTALVIMGLVAILPAIIAALLEKKLSAMWVAPVGAVLHGICALLVFSADNYASFLAPLIFMPFIMIFTHTFLFGYMAKLDVTGRIVSSTAAMLMTGSAIGPFLGGNIVQSFSYSALGVTCFAIALISAGFYLMSKNTSEGNAVSALS